ncbi:MAG: hypothetical protein AAB484_00640 [Patescibacteria group bacterium]
MKKIIHFFDKLEDKIRGNLSHIPIPYSIIGGVLVVLFWRGIWHTADILMSKGGILGFIFYEPVQVVITMIGLLMTGLAVSVFIGDRIIISGLRHEKKIEERTEELVEEEEVTLISVRNEIRTLRKQIETLKK